MVMMMMAMMGAAGHAFATRTCRVVMDSERCEERMLRHRWNEAPANEQGSAQRGGQSVEGRLRRQVGKRMNGNKNILKRHESGSAESPKNTVGPGGGKKDRWSRCSVGLMSRCWVNGGGSFRH